MYFYMIVICVLFNCWLNRKGSSEAVSLGSGNLMGITQKLLPVYEEQDSF